MHVKNFRTGKLTSDDKHYFQTTYDAYAISGDFPDYIKGELMQVIDDFLKVPRRTYNNIKFARLCTQNPVINILASDRSNMVPYAKLVMTIDLKDFAINFLPIALDLLRWIEIKYAWGEYGKLK